MMIRRAIVYSIGSLAIISLPLQCIIDFSTVNIASACIVLASSLMTLIYIGGTDALDTHPLSTFSIVGLCITQQLGALLVQTAAWTAIESSLYDPIYTFGILAIMQITAISVHIAYRFFSKPKPAGVQFFRGLLTWAGVYRTPPCNALWLMGLLGLASHGVFISNALQMSVVGKLGMGFNFLAWAPFLIPYYHGRFGEAFCSWKINRVMLVIFGLSMGGIGLAMNARGIMLTGVATIALLYFLLGLRSTVPVTRRFMTWVGVTAVVIVTLGGPVSDLVTSMAIARYMGANVSSSVKLERALWVWHHPAVIQAFREELSGFSRLAYNEHYIENPILQRFVETKFDDNSFHFGRLASSEIAQERLREVSIKFLWGALPTPLLDQMGVNVTKNDLNFSMGDYLPHLTEGQPLGAHRVGSMFGQGMALFGVLFPLVFAGMCVVLFYLMDLLTIREAGDVAHVSAVGILQIWNYFLSGLSYEALHLAFWFIVRVFWQTMLIYVVVLAIGQLFSRKTLAVTPPQPAGNAKLPRTMSSIRANPAARA